jgi:hypothetical protein
MQSILTFGKRLVQSREFSNGTVAVVEMTDNMWAVLASNKDNEILISRNFTFTDDCKKPVMQECRQFYNFIKDCFIKKQLQSLEDIDV